MSHPKTMQLRLMRTKRPDHPLSIHTVPREFDRRFGAKPRKNFVDDQAASPSSWKTPRMAVWMAA